MFYKINNRMKLVKQVFTILTISKNNKINYNNKKGCVKQVFTILTIFKNKKINLIYNKILIIYFNNKVVIVHNNSNININLLDVMTV